MTYEEAINLKSYKHYCTCGGFAHSKNGLESGTHTEWCPQREEYEEYVKAIKSGPPHKDIRIASPE